MLLSRHRQLARAVLPLARGTAVPRSSFNNVPLYLKNIRPFSALPDHEVVGLPALSPTMEAGTIGTWHVKEGDSFEAGEVIAEVETDKATMGFEAQDPGVVAKILVEVGAEVKVGAPIMVIVDDTDDVSALVASFANFSPGASAPTPPPEAPAAPTPTAAPVTPAAAPAPAAAQIAVSGSRVFASPLARKTAKTLGYDISQIPATGPRGRVVVSDVNGFVPGTNQTPAAQATAAPSAATTAAPAAAPIASPPVYTSDFVDYPVSEQGREIAARMTRAKQEVPHYYLTVDIELSSLLETREKLNAVMSEDEQISVNDMFIKAAGLAMKTVPAVNSSWMESVVRTFTRCDINVIIGAGDSSRAPLLLDTGSKGLKSISEDMKAAMAGLENGSPPTSYTAGTFSMVNLGMYGVTSAAPIVTSPQAAVLAMGAIEKRVLPSNGPESEVIYRLAPVVTATCSFDHRVVDGAVGAQWLDAFKKLIENPMTMLL